MIKSMENVVNVLQGLIPGYQTIHSIQLRDLDD